MKVPAGLGRAMPAPTTCVKLYVIAKFNYGGVIVIRFDKLWETMKEKSVSTYALREKHNIDSRTIRRLKANENTTTDTLNALCEILDCNLHDIAEYVRD